MVKTESFEATETRSTQDVPEKYAKNVPRRLALASRISICLTLRLAVRLVPRRIGTMRS